MRSKYDLAFHNVPNQKYIRISHLIEHLYCYKEHVSIHVLRLLKKQKETYRHVLSKISEIGSKTQHFHH